MPTIREYSTPADTDAYRAVAYAGYDRTARTLRLDLSVDHQPLEACGFAIPLSAEAVPTQP